MKRQTEYSITWLRHGMTKWNEEMRYLGTTDVPLSLAGERELSALKGRIDKQVLLVSSPMKRCIQTAEILFDREPDFVIEEWSEMDFGSFEGKNYTELAGNQDYQKWLDSNGSMPFPCGESRAQFQRRCMAGLDRLLASLPDSDNIPDNESVPGPDRQPLRITAVVHGGTIMAVLSSLSQKEYFDFQVKNGMGYETLLKITGTEVSMLECKELKR